ncbi:MAG: hypothetical protein R3E68_07630 [Burkholderiaceae bacterium]
MAALYLMPMLIALSVPVIAAAQPPADSLYLRRVTEPTEGAFSLLVPGSWKTSGGILRVDPLARGGPAQSIAAKLDFSVMRDAQGTVMIRWLPDTLFFDMRWSPAGQMGLFPPGSHYQGMTVHPLIGAAQFAHLIALPYAHPQARAVRVVEQTQRPRTASAYTRWSRTMTPPIDFSHDAATTVLEYTEGGVDYRELMFTMVENWGRAGAGMWGNRETVLLRAPRAEFAQWLPVLSMIQGSVVIDRQWLSGEIRGQIRRGEILGATNAEVQRLEREIGEHRARTNAEIHNDMFLTLTEKEEYINPHTNEVEVGTNQWRYRWVNPGGETIYTDREDYDPNVDVNLNRSDFKRSPVRPRFPDKPAPS